MREIQSITIIKGKWLVDGLPYDKLNSFERSVFDRRLELGILEKEKTERFDYAGYLIIIITTIGLLFKFYQLGKIN